MFDGAPSPDHLLLVGRIVRTHGLNGECKIVPESDDPNRLLNLKRIWLGDTPQTAKSYNVQGTRIHNSKRGTTILMQFAGIHTVTDAEGLGRPQVYADLKDLPPLHPGEFFLHDLIGIEVLTSEGEFVGILKDIMDTQSYSLYLVQRPEKNEVLIPAVPAFIVSTDLEQRRMVIRTIEGLLD